MAVILAVNMLVIGIFGSYQTAQAAEIVAGYGAAQILESILLSFGISIFTADMIKNGSNATWWDTDGSAALKPYYDDLEQAYEEQRFKVINGGGGQNPKPSPTPAPGNTPIPFPTTVPVPGDIPTFKELVAPALAGTAAVINMTQGAWECMGKAVSSLWDKIVGQSDKLKDFTIPDFDEKISNCVGWLKHRNVLDVFDIDENIVCFYLSDYRNGISLEAGFKDGSEDLSLHANVYTFSSNGIKTSRAVYPGAKIVLDSTDEPYSYSFNVPIYKNGKLVNDVNKKENIWVHPDLQDTYKNNGKLEYPQQAPRPLQIPTADQLADTVRKLNPEINPNYSPEVAPNYIQELIQQLQKQPDPNPDPNPNPNPNPNPDPNPDPNSDPNPDPELTPKPDEDNSNDIDPKNYTTDLKKIFPFCIPFDLVHLIQAFETEPEAPVFEFPFDLELENPWTGKKILDYHHVFKLDMSDYEPVIKIFRIFEIIFFIIGLLMITRQQMIKG